MLIHYTCNASSHTHNDVHNMFFISFIVSLEMQKKPNQCSFWRLSFSYAEKELMLHADGQGRRNGDSITCRKDILRLLKFHLAGCIAESKKERKLLKPMATYCLKTFMLNMYNEEGQRHDDVWKQTNRADMFMSIISNFIDHVKQRNLQHHFLPEVNLFQDMLKRESDFITSYFSKLLGNMLVGNS